MPNSESLSSLSPSDFKLVRKQMPDTGPDLRSRYAAHAAVCLLILLAIGGLIYYLDCHDKPHEVPQRAGGRSKVLVEEPMATAKEPMGLNREDSVEGQVTSLEGHFIQDAPIGKLPEGSKAQADYDKFEKEASMAHTLARRDGNEKLEFDESLAQGFEIITDEKRDDEADKQLDKWKEHCTKNPSRGDMERETIVEQKGHGSLGCDINRHILSSFRGADEKRTSSSSGSFACFQDSSHRHTEDAQLAQLALLDTDMNTAFPMNEYNTMDTMDTMVTDNPNSRFFNESA